jgi:hypothetical protein
MIELNPHTVPVGDSAPWISAFKNNPESIISLR